MLTLVRDAELDPLVLASPSTHRPDAARVSLFTLRCLLRSFLLSPSFFVFAPLWSRAGVVV